jgi:hypothetical protein
VWVGGGPGGGGGPPGGLSPGEDSCLPFRPLFSRISLGLPPPILRKTDEGRTPREGRVRSDRPGLVYTLDVRYSTRSDRPINDHH